MKTQASNDILIAPKIGEVWPGQGGILGALMRGINGQPDYYIIVPTDAAGYNKAIAWGERGKDIKGATRSFDGLANTQALVKARSKTPAADWAVSLVIDGHDDFYLPSRRELRALWVNVPDLFEDGYHWSSTQCSANDAWFQGFADGFQLAWGKDNENRARAVRRLSVIE
jgi:hypothetical protein